MSTYDDHRGGPGRPEPVVPAGLAHLLAQLAGPPDHWDRPEGDFGPLSHLYRLTRSERALANSMYRLGSKALARGELERAVQCLGTAAEAGHPGALFRLAVVTSRTNGPLAEVRFLVAEAARHGHGDAGRLLAATAGRLAGALDTEDPTYIGELHLALGLTSRTQQLSVRVHAAATVNGVQDAGMLDDAVGAARLVPVPVQRLARHDTNPGPSLKIPKTTADTEGRTRIRPATAPPAPAQGSRTTDIELRLEPAAVSGLVLPMHQTLTPPPPTQGQRRRTAIRGGPPTPCGPPGWPDWPATCPPSSRPAGNGRPSPGPGTCCTSSARPAASPPARSPAAAG